jgi:hypothetical protein
MHRVPLVASLVELATGRIGPIPGPKGADLIATVALGEGVELADDVGVTSHAGDLLRRASSLAAGYASAGLALISCSRRDT